MRAALPREARHRPAQPGLSRADPWGARLVSALRRRALALQSVARGAGACLQRAPLCPLLPTPRSTGSCTRRMCSSAARPPPRTTRATRPTRTTSNPSPNPDADPSLTLTLTLTRPTRITSPSSLRDSTARADPTFHPNPSPSPSPSPSPGPSPNPLIVTLRV